MTPATIDSKQQNAWEMTRAALLWNAPAFTHILYSMMTPDGEESAYFTKDVPIAATDGSRLLLNPDTFFKYNLDERVFVIAHEIMHCVLDHIGTMHQFTKSGKVPLANGKTLPFDAQTMNVATDLIINDLLITSKVGAFNKDWLHDRNVATQDDSAIDAYAKVFKQQNGGGGGPKGGTQQFDQHLPPGQGGSGQKPDPSAAQQQRNQAAWTQAVAAARDAAKARGNMSGDLERFFDKMLTPQVSWTEHITGIFARKVGSGGYDWRRPDRQLIVRDIYSPARSGNGAGTIAVAVDTSGSIGQPELDVFFAEMRGIIEDVNPQRVLLMWCDAKVHKVDELEEASDLAGVKPYGGGGTAFEPVFDWLAQEDVTPDALVYLTDGMGSFPQHAPDYPVIWGSLIEQSKYPWGDVVQVPLKK